MEGLFVLRSINFNYREGSGQGGLPKEKWKASFLTTTATLKKKKTKKQARWRQGQLRRTDAHSTKQQDYIQETLTHETSFSVFMHVM